MSAEQLKEVILVNAPCPPLHLVLGTNTLVKLIEKVWEWGLREWVNSSLVGFKSYFGGTLEGNQCSQLLDNSGILEQLAKRHGKWEVIMPFVRVLRGMCAIKKACFSKKLDPNFEAICDEFRESLDALDGIHNFFEIHEVNHASYPCKAILQTDRENF